VGKTTRAAAAVAGGDDVEDVVEDVADEGLEAAAVTRFGCEVVARRVLQCEDVYCQVVQNPCQRLVLYVKAERGE
jgi:hypothetical protein